MTIARRSILASIMRRAHEAARRMRSLFATYREALSHALKCVYRSAQAKAYLKANAARVLLARFVKADGSVRRMRFVYTLGRPETDGTVTVWDYERGATRRINLDTLAEIIPAPAPDRAPMPRAAVAVDVTAFDADMNAMTDEELDAHARAFFG